MTPPLDTGTDPRPDPRLRCFVGRHRLVGTPDGVTYLRWCGWCHRPYLGRDYIIRSSRSRLHRWRAKWLHDPTGFVPYLDALEATR